MFRLVYKKGVYSINVYIDQNSYYTSTYVYINARK